MAAADGVSLRWRLLRSVGLAAILMLATTGLLSHYQASHEAEELMDGHLAREARLLLSMVNGNESRLADLKERLVGVERAPGGVYEPRIEFQVGDLEGNILIRSENAPAIPVLGVAGYLEIEREGNAWRIFNFTSTEAPYRVQVAQPMQIREQVALEVATQVLWPLAIVLPVLLVLLYYSVRRGLRPLDDLAAEVGRLTPDTLQPLSGEKTPREAMPLVQAMNRLLKRLTLTLENERRFTADAAHELRTPLAALKVHAEVALASDTELLRQRAIGQVKHGVDRAGHLVDQLLRLARLDPLARLTAPRRFDLVECMRQHAVAYCSQGLSASHELHFEFPEQQVLIDGDPDLLGIVFRNLLDNAQRYSDLDTLIVVSVTCTAGVAILEVRDQGPGVAEEELRRLSQRFYRGQGQTAEGSGLGLAIVQRIAELHDAQLCFANHPTGGLQVRLIFSGADVDQRASRTAAEGA